MDNRQSTVASSNRVGDICVVAIIIDRCRCDGENVNRCCLNPGHISFLYDLNGRSPVPHYKSCDKRAILAIVFCPARSHRHCRRLTTYDQADASVTRFQQCIQIFIYYECRTKVHTKNKN